MAQRHGGHRPGAGRRHGSKNKATLEKEAARQLLRDVVLAELRPMTEAQITKALGVKYLVLRSRKTGKFIRLAQAKAEKIKNKDFELVEVWEAPPSTAAFTSLLDRTIDKPVEHYEHDVEGRLVLEDLVTQSKSET